MSVETFHGGRVTLHGGDCLDVLATLPEASVDAVVTDPPYHFASIVKRFGAENAAAAKGNGRSGVYKRASKGFMGKTWDGGQIAHEPETWAAVLRVLKPGGHLVAFHAPKNWHRLACAIEDAGFEIRDNILWLFGSGFPKSHDVSKAIDRAAGAERQIVGLKNVGCGNGRGEGFRHNGDASGIAVSEPATEAARQWEGWGTALKPAYEPIVLARKPFRGSVAECVQEFGTGALNIDRSRIETGEQIVATRNIALGSSGSGVYGGATVAGVYEQHRNGRWPANIAHDGSAEVLAAFPDAPGQQRPLTGCEPRPVDSPVYGVYGPANASTPRGDGGSAARFFYCAKADAADRIGSRHPTVKPVDLMRWLVRMVTPPGGTVLDIFAGTGTTAAAAFAEGFDCILIEREEEYRADIRRRMELLLAGDFEKIGKLVEQSDDFGPLFGGAV